MTDEANLEILRSIYADWGRGDFSSVEWASPDIEFVLAGGPDPDIWHGLAGMSEGYGEWLRAWEGFRAEPEEYKVLDRERVLVLVRNGGRGRTSGLELVYRSVANLFHLQHGKVTRLVVYLDRGLAFADLGLGAQSGASDEADRS
jgi:ketosteroid isomerase-like protein